MPFSLEDFNNKETLEKLQVIVMSQLCKSPLTLFNNLTSGDKKRYNLALNSYIKTLPHDNWQTQLDNDFNTICIDDLFTPSFKPEHHTFGCAINTDIVLL